MSGLKNWAGNFEYGAERVLEPQSLEQLQYLVASSSQVKALGSRHCFNTIADTLGDLIRTSAFTEIESMDRNSLTATVGAGISYGKLGPILHQNGLALRNLASLPHISVAGAIATSTHGSGVNNGSLATDIVGLKIVLANGELLELKRGHPDFPGTVVGLGALGILTSVTLSLVPTFEISQTVFVDLPFEDAINNFEEIMSAGYSVSLFTEWKEKAQFKQVWVKALQPVTSIPGAQPATSKMNPVPNMDAVNCTEQFGQPGPWFDKLPHFKLEFTPSAGAELQTEYLLDRKDAPEALRRIFSLRDRIAPLLQVCEIRTIAADDLWMSPSYERDSVAIHFTWKQEQPEVEALLTQIESVLSSLAPRPHWGKLFGWQAQDIVPRYPRYTDFIDLVTRMDPNGKFRNSFLNSKLFMP